MSHSALAVPASPAVAPTLADARRIPELDGLRGLMTLFVLFSHFFGEVPHGVRGLMVGWVAVGMFFVLSGFLIGRLILERKHHANFFAVFYIRRLFRLYPLYVMVAVTTWGLIQLIDQPWLDAEVRFPLWSYLTFTQTWFIVAKDSIGAHWLAHTWTLAVEEHFYLVAPALLVFTPARWLVRVMVLLTVGSVALRVGVYSFGLGSEKLALAALPFRADLLLCGVLAGVAYTTPGLPLGRALPVLRVLPVAGLLAMAALHAAGPAAFGIWGPLALAIGCASLILAIVLGAPEAARFGSPVLRFFGDTGYAVYLIHLPMLGLAHGLILGAGPDIGTPVQLLVTVATLPAVIGIGWALTRAVEEPMMRLGRRWRWSTRRRGEPAAAS